MIPRTQYVLLAAFLLACVSPVTIAQAAGDCRAQSGVVAGKIRAKLVDLNVVVNGASRRFVQFTTPLPVTTDGAPNSYNAAVPTGDGGLNHICNAIPAYQLDASGNRIRKLTCKETLVAYAQFRDHDWTLPPGIELNWRAGLASTEKDGRTIPCEFSSGPFRGFLATTTGLKNGLSTDAGECRVDDQIDPRSVYGITIQWGRSFIRDAGTQLGDLAIVTLQQPDGQAMNVPAIVIDSGGTSSPAMGTIALNAKLNGKTGPFENGPSVRSLAIGPKPGATVTIIPGSAGYKLRRPYTNDNIQARLNQFAEESGLRTTDALVRSVADCARKH